MTDRDTGPAKDPLTIVAGGVEPPDNWQDIDSAPKDEGKSYRFLLKPVVVRAFWSDDLQDWILDRPLTIDRLPRIVEGWRP